MITKIECFRCDKCGFSQEIREPHLSYNWTTLTAKQLNGTLKLEDRLICPACTSEFRMFWHYKTVS